MNQTIQMGRLGKDVEVKYTKSGKAFGTFSIAVPRVYRDKNTGEFVENTNWFDVVVSEKLLEFKGERLVSGALVHSGATIAVAVTGIAGPGGGTEDKPVGTVWVAWKCRGGYPRAEIFHFEGDRDAVRRQTVAAALRGLERQLA